MSDKNPDGPLDISYLHGANATYLDQLFNDFQRDPSSVDSQWHNIFQNLPRLELESNDDHPSVTGSQDWVKSAFYKQAQIIQLIDNYRRLSHLVAKVDPLNTMQRIHPDELALKQYGLSDADMDSVFDSGNLGKGGRKTLRKILNYVQKAYCHSIGYEYRYIADAQQREWLRQKIETDPIQPLKSDKDRIQILYKLTTAEILEQHLHRKYVGQKRFSLEGGDALIPMLSTLIQGCGERKVKEVVIGMAHRGRLNVLVNILGKSPAKLFDEFEGNHEQVDADFESGDVKYHQGFSSDIQTSGGNLHVALAFNPSHLEIVAPVIEGSVRARQERRKDKRRNKVVPIVIHGDAAFAGQGVVMETLNMSATRGYSTGGTVHIIINNQIGFTTNALDARSTIYCTEVAKMVHAPILHVNGDDADAVVAATELALAYRCKFQSDVILDLICYRRHGHNEADEPKLTQPIMYRTIDKKPTPRALYAQTLEANKIIEAGFADNMALQFRAQLDQGEITAGQVIDPNKANIMVNWDAYSGINWREPAKTGTTAKRLNEINACLLSALPENYNVHRRIVKIYEDRLAMTQGKQPIDWGCAEILAYGTLVQDGYHVRLSGQDSGRGTFSHRHSVVHNQNVPARMVPLRKIPGAKNKFLVINSILSEEAVLGFEYGYSTTDPQTLTIWEAQFGDFANGAQVVIDQFITSGFAKWKRISSLVLLLPHGQEGQGAEHSSARLERFLQLTAGTNMQVCVPTTPAQTFHMLRRQMMRSFRRPLIVMTPKSLLRHKLAVSTVKDLSQGKFEVILPEEDKIVKKNCKRLILCSGKVYYDLLEERRRQKIDNIALVRIEQLHPFPDKELRKLLLSYKDTNNIVWCQEEPRNQGAWYQIRHHLENCLNTGQSIQYQGRLPSATPAVGYYQLFLEQQRQLILSALSL